MISKQRECGKCVFRTRAVGFFYKTDLNVCCSAVPSTGNANRSRFCMSVSLPSPTTVQTHEKTGKSIKCFYFRTKGSENARETETVAVLSGIG